MKNTSFVFIVLFVFATVLAGRAETILKTSFEEENALQYWSDVSQKSPAGEKYCKIIEENGKKILQMAQNSQMGVARKLPKSIVINENIRKITLKVVLRQPEKTPSGHQLCIAVSSRNGVAQDRGYAFWKGRDSGFFVNGYIHSLQAPNHLAWQKEGQQVRASKATPPFGMLKKRLEWNTWTLCYDHEQKALHFYREENAPEPWCSIHNVDMSDIVLNTVWLGAFGIEYNAVQLDVETK